MSRTSYRLGSEVAERIHRRTDIWIGGDDANTLRRAEMTLRRWAEKECGDGSAYYIERDDDTGTPYHVCHDTGSRIKIPDREAGALRRVAEVCERHGLHWFHQTDPRGCMLYVSRQPMTQADYNAHGAPCCEA